MVDSLIPLLERYVHIKAEANSHERLICIKENFCELWLNYKSDLGVFNLQALAEIGLLEYDNQGAILTLKF